MEENNQFINDPIPDQVDLFINDPINDAYFISLPCGYRFAPTDAELVSSYLEGKVLHKEIPKNRFLDLDISLYHPRDLTGRITLIRESEWYFFTSRKRKYPRGQRPDRSAVDGFWKATGKAQDIEDSNGRVIGSKRTLDFYQGNHQDSKRTEWKMHEYTLNTKTAPPNEISNTRVTQLDNCVLCKIYKNTKGANNDSSTTQSDQRAEPSTNVVASQAFPDQQIQPVHRHDQYLVGQSSGASSSSTANKRPRGMPTPIILNTYVGNPTYYPHQQYPFQNQTSGNPPGPVYNNYQNLTPYDQNLTPYDQNDQNLTPYDQNDQNLTQYDQNDQNLTQYDMQSANIDSQVQPRESFSSEPGFLPPMETSTYADEMPLVDSSSMQLPVHVRLYEQLLAARKDGDFDKRLEHWYHHQQQLFMPNPSSTPNC
ncbi:NAC domain-containing protein 26 [Prunus yedoensis var. nudiflora]|uniref:NAC domain-containing protein 26 n=1 Tax=Prunus yedoensis var. nudiflora TaxID=2094558 RepID=A0A314Z1F7_PRUYE|nr:NAC domain-containing protein 26 [Prunus yedoensis var. nudiflora]